MTQDYVIIDTPPLGSVVDSMSVAKECDSVILVVSANATSRKFAAKIKNQLERNDIKLLGVVLNKVPRGKKKYGYGSYGHKNVEKLEAKPLGRDVCIKLFEDYAAKKGTIY